MDFLVILGCDTSHSQDGATEL